MLTMLDLLSEKKEWLFYYEYANRAEDNKNFLEEQLAHQTMILKLNERFKKYHHAYLRENSRRNK